MQLNLLFLVEIKIFMSAEGEVELIFSAATQKKKQI